MHIVRNFNKFSASGRDSLHPPIVQKTLQTKCTTDSKSLHDTVYSDNNPTEKKLKVELCLISKPLKKVEVESVLWFNSKNQLADYLAKEWALCEKLYDVLNGKSKLYRKKKVKTDKNYETLIGCTNNYHKQPRFFLQINCSCRFSLWVSLSLGMHFTGPNLGY